jgi:hypothetical protein
MESNGAKRKGISIFNNLNNRLNLKIVDSNNFGNGIVLNHYQPKK